MSILVTGGAGYIGSHTVAELLAHEEQVVVIDNLYQGHAEAVSGCPCLQIDIAAEEQVRKVLRDYEVDTVVHFAANSLVGESVSNPLKYYRNNVVGTYHLLEAMKAEGVKKLVFSSTAAVYGEPPIVPISEDSPLQPTNPYGETKLAMERMFHWCSQADGLQAISLRYFNAAGALEGAAIGENHQPETHLIPIVLQVALGQRNAITVFGTDFPTPDGTCVRDYVHVMDLASAHRLAVSHLRNGGQTQSMNLGSGTGYSVYEVIAAARKVTGHPIPAELAARRTGDPAVLVADASRARELLGWTQRYPALADLIGTAWAWHQAHPTGFALSASRP